MAFAENLAAFFAEADFAVAASWTPSGGGAAKTASVLFDQPDEEVLSGAVMTREYAITYRSGQLQGLAAGEVVTVEGAAYTVREAPMALGDGKIMLATLRKN